MEDEFTRRMDVRINGVKEDAQTFLKEKNMTTYSYAKGEIKGLEYAKEIYIAMELRKQSTQ